MTTQNIGVVLHEELDRREKLIQQLTTECEGLRTALQILERPSAEAHNRVSTVVGRRGRKKAYVSKDISSGFRCDVCGADDFKSVHGVHVHQGKCDGVRRNAKERNLHSQRLFLEKKKKANGHAKKPDPPESRRHLNSSLNSVAQKPAAPDIRVVCNRCGEKFNDAKSLGIHTTRVHFGESSLTRAQGE